MSFKILAAAAGMMLVPVVAHAQNIETFSGAGQDSSVDCDGGGFKIEGASNTFDISGQCSLLQIEGAGNRVRVSLADNARLIVIGADNEVAWSTPSGKKPRLSVTGAGNRVSKVQ